MSNPVIQGRTLNEWIDEYKLYGLPNSMLKAMIKNNRTLSNLLNTKANDPEVAQIRQLVERVLARRESRSKD